MEGLQRLAPVLTLVLVIVGVIIAVALWRLAGETGERACIEAAEAKYPAAPVSAFQRNRSATGPLKLSFVRERTRAVDACD
jgi:hypothetical protein